MRSHESVLLNEALDGLAIKTDGIYVDGTFGRGGHSCAILKRLSSLGRLFAFDKDPEAVAYAKEHFCQDKRFQIYYGSFAELATFAKEEGISGKINGVLLDLGLSSPQLDNPARGFSFTQKGPLDMRMDLAQDLNAAQFIKEAGAKEMATVFKELGEERFALRIANAIVQARSEMPIKTTEALADIIKKANPCWEKHKHPATRVFQAIRIHINQELTDLKTCLDSVMEVLAIKGRLVVISFHSLEDRIVKQFMQSQEQGQKVPLGLPVRHEQINTRFKRVGKAIKASIDEVKKNVRARSAVLRIGEKIA